MAERLENATAIVTGASSGIGQATARALAAEGAAVALLARRQEKLEQLAEEIGGGASVHAVDVTDDQAVREAVDAVAEQHGGIDVLVNNAGFGTMVPAGEVDFAQWRKMVDINLGGVLATTHAALPHLAGAADGRRGVADIVNVSSVAGRKVASPEVNVYSATKHAVGAFSEATRQELAPRHVRVGLVEPGLVRTELTEGQDTLNIPDSEYAVLDAEDIADAIVYMVTRRARCAINEMLVRPIEQQR